MKTIKAAALVSNLLFIVGCNSDTISLKERTITEVTPSGGEAQSAGGELTLSFSAGALSANRDIVIETSGLESGIN